MITETIEHKTIRGDIVGIHLAKDSEYFHSDGRKIIHPYTATYNQRVCEGTTREEALNKLIQIIDK